MRWLFGTPLIVIAIALSVLAHAVPSPYYVLTPGGALDIQPRISVPAERQAEMGHLAFTAVEARRASWGDVIAARFDRSAEVVPVQAIRPHGISSAEMNEMNRRLIDESKSVAALVALRAAGYPVNVTGQGASVRGVLDGAPAASVLRPGDVITAVDGQPTMTAAEVVELIRRHAVGDQVELTIVRDGERQAVAVGTRSSTEEPSRPAVGAVIETRAFDVELPFPVQIDTENVGGASAGLMFSLGILDAVTEGTLTRGHSVAGTGTISADSTVGPIGGAPLKVMAAERAGADVFLVPRENYEEARAAAHAIQVIAVDRFADAIRALCSLPPTPDAALTLPPPCAGQ